MHYGDSSVIRVKIMIAENSPFLRTLVEEFEREHIRETIFIESITSLFNDGAEFRIIYDHLSPFISRLFIHGTREEFVMHKMKYAKGELYKQSHLYLTDQLTVMLGNIEFKTHRKTPAELWQEFCQKMTDHIENFDKPLYEEFRNHGA